MPHFRAPRLALRSAGLIALSFALHLLMLVVFPEASPPRPVAHQGSIWLELDEYAPASADRARARREPRPQDREQGSPLRRAEARVRTARGPATAELAPGVGAGPEPESLPVPSAPAPVPTAPVARPEPATATAAPPAPDLSPRGVALAALPPPAPRLPVDDRAALRSAELSAELNAAANARPSSRRAPPQLKRDPDGTCHYEGEAIAATILPDGGVQFEDKGPALTVASVEPLAPGQLLWRGGVAEPTARPVTPEDLRHEQRLELRVKMTAPASKAERDWFLRETAALRRELADATHARELSSAHALWKQLDRIWCDGSQRPAQRRRALFELWDETSDDEMGEVGRDVVIDYIQLNLPPSSPDAYPAQQLAALNAGRTQRGVFDPYANARDR